MQTSFNPTSLRNQLRKQFGIPEKRSKRPVLDELIMTVLSQNTTDVNRDRAYRALRNRYSTWEDALRGNIGDLEEAILPAGLGPTKSVRIMQILKRACEEGNCSGFDKLNTMSREDARSFLLSLPGVGPKTAACVLLFSCDIPAFPVDTHVFRVCGRLGLLPENAGREKAHDVAEEFFPEADYLEVHLNIIKLGRTVCRPKNPLCTKCPLSGKCVYWNKLKVEIGG
ncbi:MAG: endonuclease III [bacterium]